MEREIKKRDIKYEVIRVVAMVFVITIHQLDKFEFADPTQHNLLSLIFLTCNGLFFMLSGKFALNFDYSEKNCYKKYYFGKFVKIIIPVLIYMALKQLYLMYFTFNVPITLKSFVKAYILSVTEGYIVTEYWFVYYLIANLLVAPFLARIFKNLNTKECYLFFAICLICNALSVYPHLIGITFAVPFYLSGMNIYFFLGSYIDKITQTKKQKILFIILGIISYIVGFIQLQIGKAVNIFDAAPTAVFVVCLMYILLRDHVKVNRGSKIIYFLGKYSFSIYLIHVVMMDFMTYIFPYKTSWPISIYVIIKVILILIGSLILAIVIDNTIIKIAKDLVIKLNDKIEEKIQKRKNNAVKLLEEERELSVK